jgi:hypothetical protein
LEFYTFIQPVEHFTLLTHTINKPGKNQQSFSESASTFALVYEPLGLRSMTADAWHKSMMDSARKTANFNKRVHENCLTDRPPWDDTPLRVKFEA